MEYQEESSGSENNNGKIVAQSLHSLDKRTKCQTRSESDPEKLFRRKQLVQEAELAVSKRSYPSNRVHARIAYRPWSDEWRLRISPEFVNGKLPPVNSGERSTSKMTEAAISKIEDSAMFVDVEHGGYRVFATVTLNKDARERINNRITKFELITYPENGHIRYATKFARSPGLYFAKGVDHFGVLPLDSGDYCPIRYEPIDKELLDFIGPSIRKSYSYQSSVQREVSRFFDGIKKMRLRGWIPEYRRGRKIVNRKEGPYTPIEFNTPKIKLPGSEENITPFCYLWVAENPKNKQGEDNIHVHLLMNWDIPYRLFSCWAKRLERLWGQGYVHLERIKDTKCSAYYLSKAAQYLSKASKANDQGLIRGNRYAISKHARAPGWESVGKYSANGLGYLIMLAKVKHQDKYGLLSATRRQIIEEIKAEDDKKTRKSNRLKSIAHHIGGRIKSISSVFGRYNCVFKGEKTFDMFVGWCCLNGWKMSDAPDQYHIESIKRKVKDFMDARALLDMKKNYSFDLNGLKDAYYRFSKPSQQFNEQYEVYKLWSM